MDSTIIYVSSSIENWKDKIGKKYGPCIIVGKIPLNYKGRVIFFGMYSFNDYKRVWKHKGPKVVVWCGSDLLYLKQWQNWWRRWWLLFIEADHICENEFQEDLLLRQGIIPQIKYNFFGKVEDFPVSFKPSETPHVFIHCPEGREEEYGLEIIKRIKHRVPEITFHIYGIRGERDDNIIYHGKVSEEQFNKEIINFQAGIRLNHYDGFSEVISKSLLNGGYPISFITYPAGVSKVSTTGDLICCLKELKNKTKPNPTREWWVKELSQKI